MSLLLALILSLSAATALTADNGCRRTLSFAEPLITSSSITSAAYGDFDEDGHADVALMLDGDTRVIALSRGSVFQPMPRERVPPLGSNVFEAPIVAATDINRDGHVDLIYRRYNTVWVALGRGDGSFQPFLSTTLPRSNTGLWRTVDFNHDGILDFVDFDFNSGGFTFVQSKGDGTFGEVAHVDLSGGFLQSIVTTAGDFDGDGNVDVVRLATDLETFKTLVTFGWNDGKFHFTETQETVELPHSLQPIDIDGDGAEELVGIENGSLVIVRARNRHIAVDRIPVAPAGASQVLRNPTMLDVDDDGIRDLVFSTGSAIGIIWGTGGNSFRDATYFELPGSGGFAPVDLDGDGVPDLAATSGSQGLSVLYRAAVAASRPNANRVYPLGFVPANLDFVDVDGDGARDLVGTSGDPGNEFRAMVLFGDGRGGFQRSAKSFVLPSRYSTSRSFAGDFDGDGHADLAITSTSSGSGSAKPILAFGSSDGFSSPTLEIDADLLLGRVFLGSPSTPALIALKGDDVQLVTISSGRNVTASTIYHRPTGADIFVVHSAATAPAQIAVVATDGIRLVTRASDGWHESVLALSSAYRGSTSGIASADLDGDGRADFVVWSLPTQALFAGSDGSYRRQGLATVGAFIDSVTPIDFDRDGLPDLVVTARGNFGYPGTVQVLHNTGGGNFQPYATATSAAPFRTGVVVDDIDGDGWPDLVIPSFDGAEVLKNICATPRIHVASLPADPTEGSRVTLVIHAISTDALAVGSITISEGSKTLLTQQPGDFATVAWVSPALSPGTHTFRVEYQDQYFGSSLTDVVITTRPPIPRRRAARH